MSLNTNMIMTKCIFLILYLHSMAQITPEYVKGLLDQRLNMSSKVWTADLIEQMFTKLEQNLKLNEKDMWAIDVRAGLQIFMTKMNLKLALNSSRIKEYEENKNTPMKKERMHAIVNRNNDLSYFLRYRVLARVPRLNLTRQVTALYMFTELPWFKYLPSLSAEDEEEYERYIHVIMERKFNRSQVQPFPSPQDYATDLVLGTSVAKNAQNITLRCLEALTLNPVNETAMNATAWNETVPRKPCQFPRELHDQCYKFVRMGTPFKTMYGHVNFFRIVVLTAARLARNCYFKKDLDTKIIAFLCFIARIEIDQIDKNNPSTFESSYYESENSLTKHDYANLCLLNGHKKFLRNDLVDCTNDHLVWDKAGCYGPKDAQGSLQNLTTPLPWWIILRPNMHENGFCSRRVTASCLSYLAIALRGLVEMGDTSLNVNSTTAAEDDVVGGTTEFLP